MAVVFVEGFDAYTVGSLPNFYDFVGGSLTLVSGRFGGQAVRILSSNSSNGWLRKSLSTSLTQGTIGFAIKFTTLPTDTSNLHHAFTDINDDGIGLQYLSNGAIRLISTNNAYTSLGIYATTAIDIIKLNVWHYIELEFTIANSGGVLNLYVDGQLVSSGTYDTLITTSSINVMHFGPYLAAAGIGVFLLDDIYIANTSTRLGEQKIETLRPSADTAQKQWTPSTGTDNYALVDETLMNNTDFISTNVVNNLDLYDFDNLSSTPTSISAVAVSALAQKDNVGTRAIAITTKSGSTTSDGANNYLGIGYTLNTRLLETDPNTAGAWTAAGVNALQAGIKVTI